jgi:tRNA threonylcarbamoyladenosine biosynthesis protein TsaB
LETTEAIGSVAAAIDDKLLLQIELSAVQRSAQSLAPGVKTLLERVGWRPADVELVAVTAGPGSFTGLRVGVAFAKVLAYSVRAEVLGVDTLQAIAVAAPSEIPSLAVAIDAQRGDVVAGTFRRGPDTWLDPAGPSQLLPAAAWLAGLAPGTTIAGPVLKKLQDRLPPGVTALEPNYWHPTAANVARLAVHLRAAGRRDDLWGLLPHYSRRAAAEEQWDRLGK